MVQRRAGPAVALMSASARVLVVEDEAVVAEVVERYLRRDGHQVRRVARGDEALASFDEFAPELVVLDIMLPGIDGLEVCRRIRQRSNVPVIMLTARGEEVDKLMGLGIGADDYVTKPFSPRELAARVAAVLRRATVVSAGAPIVVGGEREPLRFERLVIDPVERSVLLQGEPVTLTAREFDLLQYLAEHPRQVFTREQLLDAVWDREFTGGESTVTVHMRRVRSKVESDASRPRHLKTVWGVGYKFEP